jgi:hypothetical protein
MDSTAVPVALPASVASLELGTTHGRFAMVDPGWGGNGAQARAGKQKDPLLEVFHALHFGGIQRFGFFHPGRAICQG